MRIVSVTIENFRAIEHLSLRFVDDLGTTCPLTVIAGPNGAGKTSLLFAITNALRGIMGYRTAEVPTPTPDDIRLPKTYRAGWTNQRPEAHVAVELEFDADEQRAIPELVKLIHKEPPPQLVTGRLTVRWKFPPGFDRNGLERPWSSVDIEPPKLHISSWLKARTWAIQAWMRKSSGMTPDLLSRVGGMWFFPQDRNLRTRVLGDDFNTSSGETVQAEGIAPDTEGDLEKPVPRERTVSEILHYLSDFAKNRQVPLPDERNWEKRIQDLFHRVCSPKKYIGYLYREENPLGAPILQDGDHAYPLSHAASGEQVILEYITRLTYPSPLNKSIILIDEPEIHLHPSWIRQLYLALPRIGDGNQYILTTHSAELRQRAVADNALIDLGSLESTQ